MESASSVVALSAVAFQLIANLEGFYKQAQPIAELKDLAQDFQLFKSVLKESTALIQSLSRPPPPSAELALDRCSDVEKEIQKPFEDLIRFQRKSDRIRRKVLAVLYFERIKSTTLELEKTLGRFKEAVLLLRDIASDSLTQEICQGVMINANNGATVFFNTSFGKLSKMGNVTDHANDDNNNAAPELDQENARWPQYMIQRDPYIFNGSINPDNLGDHRNWYPVRGMYDSGSIEVNLVRRDVLERAKFDGMIVIVDPVTVEGIGEPVPISESVNLRWAPDNDIQSYVAQCLVIDILPSDLLICKSLMQKYNLAEKNKSIVPTTLPMRNKFRSRAERAREEQETTRLDREALEEEQKRQELNREHRRAVAAQTTAPAACNVPESSLATPSSN